MLEVEPDSDSEEEDKSSIIVLETESKVEVKSPASQEELVVYETSSDETKKKVEQSMPEV